MKELVGNSNDNIDYVKVLGVISNKVKFYLSHYKIKALVIGVSGGLDSGLNAAILSPICKELNIPLIGRYIHIESNKLEERVRAELIGKCFCTDYKEVDLTELYNISLPTVEENFTDVENTFSDKIRRGNIKARLRMIYLYNLAQTYNGIVVDNDNMTEHLLGFWTLNGDVGDITPLASLFKTEVFELAKVLANMFKIDSNEYKALYEVINAVPTDGLGITSSDVEQFGVKSYDEVDDILIHYKYGFGYDNPVENYLYQKYGKECVDKVISRHLNSGFKRNHPYKITLDVNDIKK